MRGSSKCASSQARAGRKALLLHRFNMVQREILHICGQAVAPVFQIRAFRDYAMRRAPIAAGFGDEDYPALQAKHLESPRLFANREDPISSMRSVEGGSLPKLALRMEFFLNTC